MAIIEFVIIGLGGFYLSFSWAFCYGLFLNGAPLWMLYDPDIPAYVGSMLFGVEVVQLIKNVRKHKKNAI